MYETREKEKDEMRLSVTESALEKLHTLVLTKGQLPRIDADVSGGCGMSVEFSLVFDEARRNDYILELNGIHIRMDRFTHRYIGEETQIDFTEEKGFFVGDQFFSSACSIEIV
jgi:Fe-S cluster assembly iron-binding protein IscA